MNHPPELRATVVAQYAAGASTIQLGRAHGIGPSTILRWLDAAGIERRPAHQPAEARTCTEDNCDRRYHSRGYCRLHYGRHITGHQPRDPSPHIHLEDVEWLAETGESWPITVQRLGVKENTLMRHLERAGRYDLIRKLQRREVAA